MHSSRYRSLKRAGTALDYLIKTLLEEIIIEKIKSDGPLSFHDFMESCLYYPGQGYYTSPKIRLGKQGDYYTSSYVTPVFGAMIARQLEEMWAILGEKKFMIIEYGAGTGMLAHDILYYIKTHNEKFFELMEYSIIEKSPVMREIEKGILTEKVKWYNSINEIPNMFPGCVLSNELLDNFSIHQVIMDTELMEVFVGYRDGFFEMLRPAEAAIKNYFCDLGVFLPKGFRTEVNLEAVEWMRTIAQYLKEGFVMTIDYGYPSSELYAQDHRQGTLICYHNHRVNEDPYHHIGEQDITAHVNFSALYHTGKKYGLKGCGLANQQEFLIKLGIEDFLEQIKYNQDLSDDSVARIKNLLLDEMGNKFKILIQQKGLPGQQLRCMQRDAKSRA